MKIFIMLGLFVSSLANANTCYVKSKFRELESGLNKQTICIDTLNALGVNKNLKGELYIQATGARSTYSVELNSIIFSLDNHTLYNGAGVLNWFPGDSYVNLKDLSITYSKEILDAHKRYNNNELESIKRLLVEKVKERCSRQFKVLKVEILTRDVDLYVSWDEWSLESLSGEKIAQIEVTLWQAPGQFEIDKIEFLHPKCQ